MAKVPRLPHAVWSQHGPLPVVVRDLQAEGDDGFLLGAFDVRDRDIEIEETLGAEARWATLGHEICESALCDAGMYHLIEPKLKEAICDAIGSWIAGAVLDGSLKFSLNRQADDMQ